MLYFDLETTNHHFGSALDARNKILIVAYALDDGPVRVHCGDILDATEFWHELNKDGDACAWNCKFEQHWLLRMGFDIDRLRWHDPMLAEKVILGNTRKSVAQDATAKRYGYDTKDPMIDSLMKAGVCPSDMPQARLVKRAIRDVRTMRQIYRRQLSVLRENEQIHLVRTRCNFATVLTHIEANGMYLDYEVVMKHYARYATEAAESKRDLDELTGGINMRSGPQVAHFLYSELKFPEKRDKKGNALRNKPSKQFPDGAPRVDKMTMNWLATKCETPNQREFIALRQQYSKANAALTKNLEFFKGVCEEYAGKFHGQFNQTVASTHRLTASGMPLKFLQFDKDKSVQFQNMPREFKDCFVAPEGYVVVEADAMQLEFRVAAFLGHDKQALADIADPDFDAHIFSASEINGLSYRPLLEDYRRHSSKAKVLRQRAKEHTFKPLYGGTKGTDGEERYYKKFAERYAGIAAEQENWLAEVMATGKLKLPWGMQFTWDVYINSRGLAMNRETNKPVGPQVSNYPVQNLATAEIVPIAIIYLYKACKEAGIDVIFVNTVHDSVICYVKNDEKTIEAFKKIASAAFTSDVYNHLALLYGIDFDVPLGTEMKIGSHWGVGEEFKYDDVVNRRIV